MKLVAVIFASVLAMTIANAQTPSSETAKPDTKTAQETTTEKTKDSKSKSAKKEAAKEASKKEAAKPEAAKSADPLPNQVKKLITHDTFLGQGKVASKGKQIKVHYTGWLYDSRQPMGRGRQFDTSVGREPFTFTLGGGEVIKGWDDGFENMKVGGKRKLIIPSEMGYGVAGAGTEIPPNSPLMFEVELVDVL